MSVQVGSHRPRVHVGDGMRARQQDEMGVVTATTTTAAAAAAAAAVPPVASESHEIIRQPVGNLGNFVAYTTPRTRLRYFSGKDGPVGYTAANASTGSDIPSGGDISSGSSNGPIAEGCRRVPFFRLGDLWESFEEWSCYGVGVPIETGRGAHVTQYYVPYLSGIQLFARHERWSPCAPRLDGNHGNLGAVGEENGVSDRQQQGTAAPNAQQHRVRLRHSGYANNREQSQELATAVTGDITALPSENDERRQLGNESCREACSSSSSSSSRQEAALLQGGGGGGGGLGEGGECAAVQQAGADRGDGGHGQGSSRCPDCGGGDLCFQFFEKERPHLRPPLHDKLSELKTGNDVLVSTRSVDLHPSSWFAIAWYPSCAIPTSLSRADLGASFLTFHSLSSPLPYPGETCDSCRREFWAANSTPEHQRYPLRHPAVAVNGGVPADNGLTEADLRRRGERSLPPFGFCAYRAWGPLWADRWQVEGLTEAANAWVKQMRVAHPDHSFFLGQRLF